MQTSPKLTVFMPVHNGAKYIKEAINSILCQTFKDFELLIINDGSTDDSVKIIESFNDPRVRLLHNQNKMGLVAVRNRGVEESRGEFLAFLDCDDIAHPKRLEQQINFFKKNPGFGLIGSWVKVIDSTGKTTGVKWKNDLPPGEIPAMLIFNNYFAQSALMIRKKAIPAEPYRIAFPPAEDYDLWIRISEKWLTWNLQKFLLKYRVHGESTSQKQRSKQQDAVDKIVTAQLLKLDIYPSPEELEIHRTNYLYPENDILNFLIKREAWLKKLKTANLNAKEYDTKMFNNLISKVWLATCDANAKRGFAIWREFWQSPLSQGKKNWTAILKFAIKCGLKK